MSPCRVLMRFLPPKPRPHMAVGPQALCFIGHRSLRVTAGWASPAICSVRQTAHLGKDLSERRTYDRLSTAGVRTSTRAMLRGLEWDGVLEAKSQSAIRVYGVKGKSWIVSQLPGRDFFCIVTTSTAGNSSSSTYNVGASFHLLFAKPRGQSAPHVRLANDGRRMYYYLSKAAALCRSRSDSYAASAAKPFMQTSNLRSEDVSIGTPERRVNC